MNPLDQEQKDNLLQHITRVRIADLIEYMQSGQISYQEMKATGKLTPEKDNLLKEEEKEFEKERKQKEEKAMIEQSRFNSCHSMEDYRGYLADYPNGKYRNQAEQQIADLREKQIANKENLLKAIKTNTDNDRFLKYEIQTLLNDGDLTQQDLIAADIITEKALEVFLNPPDFITIDAGSWANLPALPVGSTDVYFFGVPRSGKSTVLAGLLYQAHASSAFILQPTGKNARGRRYMHLLNRCIRIGYAPDPTLEDTVNYISFDLINNTSAKKQKHHPISMIEMSGEYFNTTYEKEGVEEKGIEGVDAMGAKSYLKNKNRKVIYLVIDYKNDEIDGEKYDKGGNQEEILSTCLDLLDKDGTLKKTDSIQIIVTKCDLMPENKDREKHTREFLKEKYNNLINQIKIWNKKYDIHPYLEPKHGVIYHSFSLGRFMLARTFEYNPDDAISVLESLLKNIVYKKDPTWWHAL